MTTWTNGDDITVTIPDVLVDTWVDAIKYVMMDDYDITGYPRDTLPGGLHDLLVYSSEATMTEYGYSDFPLEGDHRCVIVVYGDSSVPGSVRLVWSRAPAASDDGYRVIAPTAALWLTALTKTYPDGSFADPYVTRVRGLTRIFAVYWPNVIVDFAEISAPVTYGDRQYRIVRYTGEDAAGVFLSIFAAGEEMAGYPSVGYIEEKDRIPLTGVEFMPLESEDLSKIADLIERVLAQKVTISLNNGRIVVQWPCGETVEEARA